MNIKINGKCKNLFKLSESINRFFVPALTIFYGKFPHARSRKQSVSFIHSLEVSIIFLQTFCDGKNDKFCKMIIKYDKAIMLTRSSERILKM